MKLRLPRRAFAGLFAVLAISAATLAVGVASAGTISNGTLYFGSEQDQSIGRVNLDGSNLNATFIYSPDELGVAADSTYVYWAIPAGSSCGKIARAKLDGTSVNLDFISNAAVCGVRGVAVNGSHIFWTDSLNQTVGRANLDGSGVNGSFVTGVGSSPFGIAANNSNVYFVSQGSTNYIERVGDDGTGLNRTFLRLTNTPQYLTLDSAHLYWPATTPSFNKVIGRANLDGTGLNEAFFTSFSVGAQSGIAVSPSNIYFANANQISSIKMDGTGLKTVAYPAGRGGISGLAITPPSASLALSPASIAGNGSSTTTATFTATDTSGNPVTGDHVSITSSGNQTVGPVSETSPGVYSATITSTRGAGSFTITATDSSATPNFSATATLTQTVGPAALVTVGLIPNPITANGTSTSTATATVTDANGSPVTGDTVAFTSSGSQQIGATTAGSSAGTYTATIRSTTTPGSYTITAKDTSASGQPSGAATLVQAAGPAARVSVALSPSSVVADGQSTSTATATVTDASGNPVSGDTVTIASSGSQQVGALTAGSSPGTYKATVTSTTSAGSATITARDTSVSPTVSDTATLTQRAGAATRFALSLSPASIVGNGRSTSTATATVTDANGNPVSGESVSISSDGAQQVSSVTAGSAPGTYKATIASTASAGTATITARDTSVSPALSDTATLTQTRVQATNVAVSLSPSSIVADGQSTSTATATVTDTDGQPVSGDDVSFSSSGAQQISSVTAGSSPGTYKVTITSTTSAGQATITARDASPSTPASGSATLTQRPGPATVVTVALTPASIVADGNSTSQATATVTDANGNPVSGESVSITSSGSQQVGSVTAGSGPGTYEATITSTTTAGTAQITATDTTPAAHPSGAATLTQTAGRATRVVLALSPATIVANGSSTSQTTATVTDTNGNPVSGDSVSFTSSGSQQIGAVTAGSSPGTYEATITSTKVAGSATITARDTSVSPAVSDTATLTQRAGAATHVALSLSPASIVGNGRSTSTATATVTDANGNPVSGESVSIASDGAQQVSSATAGSSPGTYKATITSTASAGTATITARDGSVSDSATLTQTRVQATNVAVSLSPSSIVANGSSTSTATATVTDTDGQPVSGDDVAFSGSGAQQISSVSAGSAPGTYKATITSTTSAGQATITARDASPSTPVSGSATLTQTAGSAAFVTLALDPASIIADGSSTSTATATVTDANGNPVSGDSVTIASSGSQQVGSVTAGSSPGKYRATITSTRTAGTAQITATDTTQAVRPSGAAALTQVAGRATSVAVSLTPATIVADGSSTSTATATVTDANGNPVSGENIVFMSSGSQTIGATSAGGTPGTYKATITSTATAGQATITATDTSALAPVSGSATLTQVAGAATSIALALSPASIVADGSSTSQATATVTDAHGNPVSGETVTIAGDGAQSISSVTPGTAPGTYTATITSTTSAGTAQITASDTSRNPALVDRATLTQRAGRASSVAVSLSPSSIVADGQATSTATATVTDAHGNPVSGDSVAFTSSGSQSIAAVTPGSGPGTYQATITASTTAGVATITATDSTPNTPVTGGASLTQVAGAATAIDLALSPASIVADGQSTAVATATVTDAHGNSVTGEDVAITSSGAQTVTSTVAGGAAGTYRATITSTTAAGSATITAADRTPNQALTTSRTLTQKAGPGAFVTVALLPATVVADGSAASTATATVTDAHGNPVDGDAVSFASSGAQHVGAATPGAAPGTYQATITSTTTAGTAQITATDAAPVTHPSGAATLTQTAGRATRVAVALTPSSIVASGQSTSTATATVTDANGNPVSGETVAFSSSGGQTLGATTAGSTAGTYTATITSSTIAGQATITATDTSALAPVSGSATLTQIAGVASTVTVALSPASIVADGSSTSQATATVTDANGNAVSGDTLAFSSSGAQVVGTTSAGTSPGTYRATIRSTKTAGSATITARDTSAAGQPSGAATLTQTAGVATNVAVALSPGTITADGSSASTATATVTDTNGNPVSGDTVTITSSGTQQIGAVSAGTTAGTYRATITSTKDAGDATITATDTSPAVNVAGTATLHQVAGPAARVSLALSPASIVADGRATSTATATVTDANGNLVTGDTVALSSSGTQTIGSVSAGTSAGTYVATITSSRAVGQATITATDGSVTDTASLTQTRIQSKNVALSLSPATIVGNGRATSIATATVTDANGDPVDDETVTIQSSGSQQVSGVTRGSTPGTYRATITATGAPGTATITAAATSSSPPVSATATLTQTRTQATHVALALAPASITADGTSTSTATATVTDGDGQPVSSDDVRFNSSRNERIGAVSPGSAAGTYQVTITSTRDAGTATITATDATPDVTVLDSATLTETAGRATTVSLGLSPDSIAADGQSASTASATVTDANGNPVSGETVTITSSGSQRVGTVTAGSAPGTYRATIVSTTTAGVAQITATDAGAPASDTKPLTQTAGTAANVRLTLSPSTLIANGTSTSTATATVTDANGNAVSGDAVAITSTGSQTISQVTAGSTPGTYVATITSSTTSGTATIRASDGSVQDTATLTQTPGAASAISLTLSPAAIVADGSSTSTATATVTDAHGNPVNGETVRITGTGTQPISAVTAGASPGTYVATITSTKNAGTAQITAADTAAALTDTRTLTQTAGTATSIHLALNPATLTANGTATTTATATVTDANGNPVPGDPVTITSSGAQAVTGVGSSTPGTYTATITATTTAGTATITARDGSLQDTATLTQTVGAAARVSVALNPSSIVADGSSTTTATATVTDAYGNPVNGETVAFSSSGAQTFGPVTAGSAPGTYRATVTSSSAPGTAQITATDSTASPAVTGAATLTQTRIPAASVNLVLSPASITANGVATSTATATVTDAGGHGLSGEDVRITSSGSQQVSAVTPGADPGTYQATITSTTTPGSFTITATDRSASPQIGRVKTLTQTAGPAGAAAIGRESVYWAAPNAIGKANVDGTGVNRGLLGVTGVNDVAANQSYLYWTVPGLSSGTPGISRSRLDGSGRTDNLISGANVSFPDSLALSSGYVFWSNAGTNSIGRANLDGSGAVRDFITGADQPAGVATDGTYVYWANGGSTTANQSIGRAKLDGTQVDQRFIAGLAGRPAGVAVDAGHLYWALPGGGLGRANLDGSGRNDTFVTGSLNYDVVPTATSLLYSSQNSSIARANLDGSSPNPSFITGVGRVTGVTTSPATDALTLSPATIAANGTAKTTATFVAQNAGGGPVSGDDVRFTASGGQSIGAVTETSPGTYTAQITSTTTSGSFTITATDVTQNPVVAATATLTQVVSSAQHTTVSLAPASIVADGSSTSVATATVTDVAGSPVSGDVVTFATSGGQSIGPVTAGSAPGTYQATITSTKAAGTATITATDSTADATPSGTATLTQRAGPVTSVAVTLSPDTIVGDGRSTSTATATVTDANGNPISGDTVTFSGSGVQSFGAVTAGGAPGTYVVTLTSSTAAGSFTITARDGSRSGTATLTQTQAPATHVALSLSPASITADGTTTTTATAMVTDANGLGVPGQTVTFASSGAQQVGATRPGALPGTYQATITATATAGTATITATDTSVTPFLSDSKTLTQTAGPAASVDVTLSPDTIIADGTATSLATAIVTDAHGNPVSGDTVAFTGSGGEHFSGVQAGGAPGTYQTTITASTSPGRFTITATDSSPSTPVSGAATLTESQADATNVTVALSPDSIAADGTSTSLATATVTDKNGLPVPSQAVRFTSSGAQQIGITRPGNTPGTYEATITSTTTPGSATITATDDSTPAHPAGAATLTQTRAAIVRVSLLPASITADGSSTTRAAISVADGQGNPVDGEAITLTSTGDQAISSVTAGGAPGTYTATITASTVAGSFTITATDSTPATPAQDIATLNQTAGAAQTVTVDLTPASIVADGSSSTVATATVRDANGNPVTGETVAFTTDGGQTVGTVIAGIAPGTYTVRITSTTHAGTFFVTATDTSASTRPSGSAAFAQTAGAAAHVRVSLDPASIIADGSSTTTATATVTDAQGNPVSGDALSFTTPGAQQVGPVSQGGPGTYTATITSSKTPGPVTVTATDTSPAGQPSGSATLTQTTIIAPGEAGVVWSSLYDAALERENSDGSGGRRTLVGTGANVVHVPVASNGTALLFANPSAGTIGRSDPDGGNANPSFVSGAGNPGALAADAKYVYWTDPGRGTIGRAALDGSSVQPRFITGVGYAQGLAVTGGHLYWTVSYAIGRADLDGTNVLPGFITALDGATGIAVDATQVYWGGSSGAVYRRDLTGGAVTIVVPRTGNVQATSGVALDGTYVYWTRTPYSGSGSIGRTRRDGTASNDAFIANAQSPYGLILRGGAQVTLNPSAIPADGRSTTTATIRLSDFNGDPVTGAAPTLSGPSGLRFGTVRETATPGTYQATVTAPIFSGSDTITATAPSTGGRLASASTTLTVTPAPPSALTLTLTPDSLPADGTSTTTAVATLKDAGGNPVSGQAIQIQASDGQQVGPVTPGRTPGTYRATITATTDVRQSQIVAVAANAPDVPVGAATLTQTIVPSHIDLSFTYGGYLIADGVSATQVNATVTDRFGNPASGAGITFTASDDAVTLSRVYQDFSRPGASTYFASVKSKLNRLGTETITAHLPDGSTASADLYLASPHPDPPIVQVDGVSEGQRFTQGDVVHPTFSCQNGTGGFGIHSCYDNNGSTSGTGTLDTSHGGHFVYIVDAISNGVTSTVTQKAVDYAVTGPPTVRVNADPGNPILGRTATVRFACEDNLDGGPGLRACAAVPDGTDPATLPSCDCDASERTATVDTTTAGPHTVDVIAVSRDGLTTVTKVPYTVQPLPFGAVTLATNRTTVDVNRNKDLLQVAAAVSVKDVQRGPVTYQWSTSDPAALSVGDPTSSFTYATAHQTGVESAKDVTLNVKITDARGESTTASTTIHLIDTRTDAEKDGDAGITHTSLGAAPVKTEEGVCLHELVAGSAKVQTVSDKDCIEKDKRYSKRYVTTAPVKVNGVSFSAPGSGHDTFDPDSIDFPGSRVTICKDPHYTATTCASTLVLEPYGHVVLADLDKGDNQVVASFDKPFGSAPRLFGLPMQGTSLKFGVKRKFDAAVTAQLELPVLTVGPAASSGAITAGADLYLDTNATKTDTAIVHVEDAYLGPLEVKDVCFAYQGTQAPTSSQGCPFFKDLRGQPFLTCATQLGTDRFSGTLDISFGGLGAAASATISNSSLASIGIKGNFGDAVPLVPEVAYLQSLAVGVCLKPQLKIRGQVGLGVLPLDLGLESTLADSLVAKTGEALGGLSLDTVNIAGGFEYDAEYNQTPQEVVHNAGATISDTERTAFLDGTCFFKAQGAKGVQGYKSVCPHYAQLVAQLHTPWMFSLDGSIDLFGINVGSASTFVNGDGTFKLAAQAGLDLSIVSVSAYVNGAIYTQGNKGFNFEGGANACVFGVCQGGEALFSTTGIAACADVQGASQLSQIFTHRRVEIGFGYTWDTGGISILGGQCDFSNYRFYGNGRALARRAGAPPGSQAITVAKDQPALILKANGAGAPPKVRLVGPDGATVVESPTLGGAVGGFGQKTMLVEDTKTASTDVMVAVPTPGVYTLEPTGPDPIASVQTSDYVPPATLTANVTSGKGNQRYVDYSYVPQADTKIDFVEDGGPKGVGAELGMVTEGKCATQQADPATRCGRIPFTPADGAMGQRKIIAQISRYGKPVENREVTTYSAPPPTFPGRVPRIRIKRHGSAATIAWTRAKNATHYDVIVKTASGISQLKQVTAKCRVVRVNGFSRATKVGVVITPMDDKDKIGPRSRRTLRGGRTAIGPHRKGDGRCA